MYRSIHSVAGIWSQRRPQAVCLSYRVGQGALRTAASWNSRQPHSCQSRFSAACGQNRPSNRNR